MRHIENPRGYKVIEPQETQQLQEHENTIVTGAHMLKLSNQNITRLPNYNLEQEHDFSIV